MADSSDRRRTSVGVLFWIAFILLVLVIFLANRGNIEQVLETTGIVDVIRDRVARDPVESGEPELPAAEDQEPVTVVTRELPPATGEEPGVETTDVEVTGESASGEPVTDEPVAPAVETVEAPERDVSRPNRRMAALYFIKVTDGRTLAHKVIRPVDYDQSPLTETIRTLIAGPTGGELDEGLLTLIPEATELISASVSGGTAYLNFNRAFRFNPLGAEGTVAQLQQIIFSSTEFSTVERVQFLIEGEQLDYLGGDGIYVGAPLGRDAFSS